MSRLRLVSYGLGPIGVAVADLALRKRAIELVGAIDNDAEKVGRPLDDLVGRKTDSGIIVEGDGAAALRRLQPDAIFHCTSSFLPAIKDQLLEAARAGVDVVSSAEELLLPDLQHREIARELHQAALEHGVTMLGTGVNPGFVLDFLAVVCSAVCADVQRVRAVRVVDAGTRRLPLQRKVGAGLSRAEFLTQEKTGRFGHIGMRESVALVGRALGLELDGVTQTVQPVIATEKRRTRFLEVMPGQVAGIHNVGKGMRGNEAVVELDLKMFVGAPDPRDEVFLFGTPDVHLRLEGGVPGDQATAAMLLNSVAQVVAAGPGLHTILDLPPPRLLR